MAMATAKKLGEVCWLHPETKGERPTARSGHSISCIDGRAILFGGCGVSADGLSQEIFNDTWELHIGEGDAPAWQLADAMGDLPNPRWLFDGATTDGGPTPPTAQPSGCPQPAAVVEHRL